MIRIERLRAIPARGEAYFGVATLDDGERVECIIRYLHRRQRAHVVRLRDPRFLRVLSIEEASDDRDCVVVEHVRGTSLSLLAKKLKREKRWFARADTIAVGRELLDALASAHDQHASATRIVDPANIILEDGGGFRLMPPFSCGMSVSHMAPEQVRGETITPAADIWSAGIVLYEMWSGRHPFRGETDIELLKAIVQSKPAPLPVPWIMSMLANRAADRPSARDARRMLMGSAHGRSTDDVLHRSMKISARK